MTLIPDHVLQDIRDRLPLDEMIGRSVALRRKGGGLWGLCPLHGERTPSFSVDPRRGRWHCYGCGEAGDLFRWLQMQEGLSFRAAVSQAADLAGIDLSDYLAAGAARRPLSAEALAEAERRRQAHAARRAEREADEAAQRAMDSGAARDIFGRSLPIVGTPAEAYLRQRGIHIPLPPSLRYHPDLPCWQFPDGADRPVLAGRFPALVGAVQDPAGRICGVWRIYLVVERGRCGALVRKAGPADGVIKAKLGKGPAVGGAVRLADWRCPVGLGDRRGDQRGDQRGDRLGIAEGIETGLSGVQMGWPSWAALSTGGIKRLVLPAGVRRVAILVDHDAAGMAAAERRAAEWRREGRDVTMIFPAVARLDLNDLAKNAAAKRIAG